jgi:two-component system response regulator AtoC
MIAERRKVLTMLHESKIDVDEAEGLLDALERAPEEAPDLEVEYITANPKVEKTIEYARKAAPGNSPVLIVGEGGTGKWLIARIIHQASRRRHKELVSVNCELSPELVFESELFGHERGAFTGALHRRAGLVELANGGTLLIDAIDQLPMGLQVKLARFTEMGEFRRIGGTETIRADVRLIALTDKDLQAEAQAGKFREDLLNCLNVILLEIPPLRERVEDIPPLTDYFLKHYAAQSGRSVPTVAPEAMDILMEYTWPLNVRDLAKVMERALVLSDGDTILPEHLSLPPDTSHQHGKPEPDSLAGQLDTLEKQLMLEALEREEWDRAKAAKALGIPRPTLNYKMAKHNIVPPDIPDGKNTDS